MAWRQPGDNAVQNIVNLTLRNKLRWNVNQNSYIFIQENAFESGVCEMAAILSRPQCVNTLRLRQNGRHFADDTYKRIFLKENVRISIKVSLKFVPKSAIDNIPALFQIMAWRRPGDKPLSEAMMVSLLTHICVARPQWVNHGIDYMGPCLPWERITTTCTHSVSRNDRKCKYILCFLKWIQHDKG